MTATAASTPCGSAARSDPRPRATARRPVADLEDTDSAADDVQPYRHRRFEPPVTPAPGRWALEGACAAATEPVLSAYVADEATAVDDLALSVCSSCAVTAACDSYATEARITVGIWGGRRRTDADARRRVQAA